MVIQHQPLRVPAGWTGQSADFVVQVERQIEKLYQEISLLKQENEKLKKRISDLEEE
jgi:cell division protein FtsB